MVVEIVSALVASSALGFVMAVTMRRVGPGSRVVRAAVGVAAVAVVMLVSQYAPYLVTSTVICGLLASCAISSYVVAVVEDRAAVSR